MKKNVKVGLMAGLLITPAIVAQAGIVQASGEVAAVSEAELILSKFSQINENSSADLIAEHLAKYKKLTSEDLDNLKDVDESLSALINAKLTYLEKVVQLKKDAEALKSNTDNLLNTNSKYIEEADKLKTSLSSLKDNFTKASNELETAKIAVKYSTDLLNTLQYYNKLNAEKTDAELFVEAMITPAKLKTLNEKVANKDAIQPFFNTELKGLVDKTKATDLSKEQLTTAIATVNTALNNFNTSQKSIINAQYVPDITPEITVSKFIAQVTTTVKDVEDVDTAITNLLGKSFTSTTTLKNSINTIKTSYTNLADYQKALVTEYDTKMAGIESALKVAEDIAALVGKSDATLSQINDIKTTYNALSLTYKDLVFNYKTLDNLTTMITKANSLQERISTTVSTKDVADISLIVADYKKLTTDEKKYITPDNQTILKAWETTVASAASVDKLIVTIKTESLKDMGNATADKNITTTKSFVKSVNDALKTYLTNFQTTNELDLGKLVVNRDRLLALKPIAEVAEPISMLTIKNISESAVSSGETAITGLTIDAKLANEKANIEPFIEFLGKYLTQLKEEKQKITELIALIENVKSNADLAKLVDARAKYDALTASGKKEISNYNDLTTLESQYKAAIKVVDLIDKLDPKAKDFATKTISANTEYIKLANTLKPAVSNYNVLESLLPIAQLMQDINKLKATADTFRTDLGNARTTFNTLTKGVSVPSKDGETSTSSEGETGSSTTTPVDKITLAKQELLVTYGPKLDAFEAIIKTADTMIANITQLGTKKGQEFMDQLTALSAQYKALDTTTKKNITNAKTLTDLEKDYKSTLKVFNLIEQLPANKDRNFASKVVAAEKAYQNLTQKQKDDVYNYKKLQDVYKAADLIARIEKLKVGSKTFDADLTQLRSEYDALSAEEKELVHNASKLTEAEDNRALAEKVVALIKEAVPSAEQYIAKLTEARAAYNALDATQKKLVTNIKDLTTHEKAVKPVLKLDDDILKLDPSNAKTFLSKFKSAEKAYDKLSITERGLLLNVEKFTGELRTIYKVADAINSVKASSKTFVADVKAARALYDALSPEYKAQISNLLVLENHELNVLGGQKVDQLIQALGSAEPTEFITKVKEARTAYKALSSANKKAVTLEAELKAQEKYMKPVEKVITEIDGLSNPKNNLSKQFAKVNTSLQKLDDKQRSYITNIEKYSNLSNVTHVYDLIEKLKPNDRYYQGNLEAAKLSYDKLSQDEKLKVTNYYKLQEAQLNVDESQNIISIIATLSPKSSTYFVDIERALAAYKEIPSSLKKQVTNYDKLKQAEKDMKAVKKVITQIEAIDPTAKTYASKAKSALKAYQKLTEEQKDLVSNYDRLQGAVNELNL